MKNVKILVTYHVKKLKTKESNKKYSENNTTNHFHPAIKKKRTHARLLDRYTEIET